MLGGPAIVAVENTDGTVGGTPSTFVDPSPGTAGPSITVPLAGVWQWQLAAVGFLTGGVGGATLEAGLMVGGAQPPLGDFGQDSSRDGMQGNCAQFGEKTIAVAAAVKIGYRAPSATCTFRLRHLSLLPVRVG